MRRLSSVRPSATFGHRNNGHEQSSAQATTSVAPTLGIVAGMPGPAHPPEEPETDTGDPVVKLQAPVPDPRVSREAAFDIAPDLNRAGSGTPADRPDDETLGLRRPGRCRHLAHQRTGHQRGPACPYQPAARSQPASDDVADRRHRRGPGASPRTTHEHQFRRRAGARVDQLASRTVGRHVPRARQDRLVRGRRRTSR